MIATFLLQKNLGAPSAQFLVGILSAHKELVVTNDNLFKAQSVWEYRNIDQD